ncbi:MAG: S-methyl-5'-thioadenosine phosphorylase [Anaerolineales bacterium]
MKEPISLAIIGGSGLYDMDGLTEVARHAATTPFGDPSDAIVTGVLAGQRVAFLARHGRGHRISPSEINYRANIYALKQLGVTRIISVSACGSLREDYKPGDIVIPDQLFDFTRGRERTFFSGGLVAHVGVADPFCAHLSGVLHAAVQNTGATVHVGGGFITIEGPRFSTRAESRIFRQWGLSLIGMTTSPEAYLAREAEICYAVMAHVTDYDVWHETEAPVTVEMVVETIMRNTRIAQQSLTNLAAALPADTPRDDCHCGDALADALITQPDRIPPDTRARLGALIDKYLS